MTPPALGFPYFESAAAIPFEPSARASVLDARGRFDDPNAWWLADASLLAYGDAPFVADAVAGSPLAALGWRVRVLAPEGSATLRAIILDGPDALVVAFRGTRIPLPEFSLAETAGLIDWILGNEDLQIDGQFFPAAHDAGGRVHEGFLHAFREISDRLDAEVAARRSGQALWLTGHSLGGALAVLAAGHLQTSSVAGVYTYGAPRVGDGEFNATLPACVHRRFVHRDDLIPKIPPAWPLGYRHAGESQQVPDPAAREGWREWSEKLNGVAIAVRRSFDERRLAVEEAPLLVRGLADHAPVYYATLLWNALAAARRGVEAPPRP